MENLDLMSKRLNYYGGKAQQDRIIDDKRWSFDHAVKYSYQGAKISHIDADEDAEALINPNVIKQDYDDKILSVGFEHNFKPGDVFDWKNTGTKWLIYLHDLTELAYFRGQIRRCQYQIEWKDSDGNIKKTYTSIRGPVETKTVHLLKREVSYDLPNSSLNILMPKNEDTLKYFKRYAKFYLQEDTDRICWQVVATDPISMEGVLEINALEYYANEDKDDIENGIVDGLVIKPVPPEPSDVEIAGEVFIKPKTEYTYEYTGSDISEWTYDKTLPLQVTIDNKTITLKWTKTYTGQFILKYGSKEKTIVVESLF